MTKKQKLPKEIRKHEHYRCHSCGEKPVVRKVEPSNQALVPITTCLVVRCRNCDKCVPIPLNLSLEAAFESWFYRNKQARQTAQEIAAASFTSHTSPTVAISGMEKPKKDYVKVKMPKRYLKTLLQQDFDQISHLVKAEYMTDYSEPTQAARNVAMLQLLQFMREASENLKSNERNNKAKNQ